MWRRALAALLVIALAGGCGRHRGAQSPRATSAPLYAVMVKDGEAPCPSQCTKTYYADHDEGADERYADCLSRCDGAVQVEHRECAQIKSSAKAACVSLYEGHGASTGDGPRVWPWLVALTGTALILLFISSCTGTCIGTGG